MAKVRLEFFSIRAMFVGFKYLRVVDLILFLVSIVLFSCQRKASNENLRPNILFISIDDLRPELGSYGSEIAISPNIDNLASQGLQFNNAYCQQSICGPSRASVLTGIRPETSGVFHNYIKFREATPDVITLPQYFKQNGYENKNMSLRIMVDKSESEGVIK